jgi:hypothetical protein
MATRPRRAYPAAGGPSARLPGASRKLPRACYFGFAGFLALAVVSGAQLPDSTPAPAPPDAPRPMGESARAPVPASPAAGPASPLDEPLRLIEQARARYRTVRDYSCVLIKRERLGAGLSPDHVIALRVRAEPFSVNMRWLQPRAMAGQEVCYVRGANDGKMRVRSAGLLGAVGFITIDPDDPRARESSRHRITEAGIGNLIERFAQAWAEERGEKGLRVRVDPYEYNKRLCTRVETTHAPGMSRCPYHRTVLYFDREHGLPIRVECYDWPRRAGDPGELLEVFSYVNLQLNVGLPEETFRK